MLMYGAGTALSGLGLETDCIFFQVTGFVSMQIGKELPNQIPKYKICMLLNLDKALMPEAIAINAHLCLHMPMYKAVSILPRIMESFHFELQPCQCARL